MCFFMRLFSKQNLEVKIFKKRKRLLSYLELRNLSTCAKLKKKSFLSVLINREYRFELIHFGIFKKYIKKVSKKNKISKLFLKKNVWVFWKPNFPMTKKSKNSRMGKGKGSFLRWSFRIGSHFTLFTIRDFTSQLRIKKLVNVLNKKFTPIFYLY